MVPMIRPVIGRDGKTVYVRVAASRVQEFYSEGNTVVVV